MSLGKLDRKVKAIVFAFLSALLLGFITPIHSSALSNVVLSDLSQAVVNCSTYRAYGDAFIAGSTTAIGETDVLIRNAAGTAYAGAPLTIAFYTGAQGAAGTLIGYETQTSVSVVDPNFSSSTYSDVQLTGPISFSSGQQYSWEFQAGNTNYNVCYNADTGGILYTTQASGWSILGYVYNSNASNAADTFMFAMGGTANTTIAITVTPGSSGLQFGKASTLSAAVTGGDGKVTFYANNKKIFRCSNLSTVSLATSCNWVPNIHGTIMITAYFTPTAGLASTASPVIVNLVKRTATQG
jgi:hypothetical protein